LAQEWGVGPVDGVLADFGQSSDQLDDPVRGFSHRLAGPLDMRYDPSGGITAAELINGLDRRGLEVILKEYGEERQAARIAAAVIRSRPIETTDALAEVVRRVCSPQFIQKTLARVFMALRMAVNDEAGAIPNLLPQVLALLTPGGRMVFISYDSHQDRPVKDFFRRMSRGCSCPAEFPVCICGGKPQIRVLTRRAIRPSAEETAANPRSRSARLRGAVKCEG
jgi:16S rRNA (cytosine1402-N4)-methyltransferase